MTRKDTAARLAATALQPKQIALELLETGLFGPEVQFDRRQLIDHRHCQAVRSEVDRLEIRAADLTLLDPHMRPDVGHVIDELICLGRLAAGTGGAGKHPLG